MKLGVEVLEDEVETENAGPYPQFESAPGTEE